MSFSLHYSRRLEESLAAIVEEEQSVAHASITVMKHVGTAHSHSHHSAPGAAPRLRLSTAQLCEVNTDGNAFCLALAACQFFRPAVRLAQL